MGIVSLILRLRVSEGASGNEDRWLIVERGGEYQQQGIATIIQ